MFKRMFAYILIAITQNIVYRIIKNNSKLHKKNKAIETVNEVMQTVQSSLINNKLLHNNLTKGDILVSNKFPARATNKLIHSFISLRDKQKEENFYLQVAREWVKGKASKYHKNSFKCMIVYGRIKVHNSAA